MNNMLRASPIMAVGNEKDDTDDTSPQHDMMEGESEGRSMDTRELDSDLVHELAIGFLNEPEGKQGLLQSIQGASDVGTAIGKMAVMVIQRIVSELESENMPVDPESAFGTDGSLVKVLTVIYAIANQNGLDIPMEESLIDAYEVASADVDKMFEQQSSGGEAMGPMPAGGPQPLMGGM